MRLKAGLSQQELAARIGVGWQTIQRLENNLTALTTKKADAIAQALGVRPEELFLPPSEDTRLVTVKGHIQAGVWTEAFEWEPDDWYEIPVPNDDGLAGVSLYAGETKGPSMDRRYPEGTVIVFTSIIETHEPIIPGKRYVVARERADGMVETTVKTLWQDEAGHLWLLPESNDPRFQEPIPVNGNEEETIRIIGRVRFAVSRE